MLAVAVAAATSRALSYGTLYTTKLLRRGQDIDRPAPPLVFGDLRAADLMRSYQPPLTVRWPTGPVLSAVPASVADTPAHGDTPVQGHEGTS